MVRDIDGTVSLSEQTLEFGVDVTAPTIEFAHGDDPDTRFNEVVDIGAHRNQLRG